jgi:hypothetical protein
MNDYKGIGYNKDLPRGYVDMKEHEQYLFKCRAFVISPNRNLDTLLHQLYTHTSPLNRK